MSQVRINLGKPTGNHRLIFLFILPLKIEAQEDNAKGHDGVAGKVDTEGDMVLWAVP